MRAAIYTRYSSDLQRQQSLEDQSRVCRDLAARLGARVAEVFADGATSGTHMVRPQLQQMLTGIRQGHFDIVITEALDRLSRDIEDVAALYKQVTFVGASIHTVSEGRISEIHVGLTGTMAALYVKQLAEKTHRGLRGRVEAGRSGGGNSYGYKVVRDGAERGARAIVPDQAAVIIRIFTDYAAGISPRAIAHALNAEGAQGPRGRGWDQSTINGNRKRGTGILNNELYIGRLMWNRQRFLRDPETRRRVSRPNSGDDVVVTEVPELRIVPDALWNSVKDRQTAHARPTRPDRGHGHHGYWETRRPQHLLSGLIKCGACGGGMVLVGKTHYGCATARNKGTCTHRLTMRRDRLESLVLDGLKRHLVTPKLMAEFVRTYHEEINRSLASQDAERRNAEREVIKVETAIANIIEAIKAGLFHPSMKVEMDQLEARKAELAAALAAPSPSAVRFHPNLAELYTAKVDGLAAALNCPEDKPAAMAVLRELIEEIRLVPEGETYAVELAGDLAALLRFASEPENAKRPEVRASGRSTKLVAGAGFEPATFRL